MIDVHFFARLREQLQSDGEELDASKIYDVNGVIEHLRSKGGVWEESFGADQTIMVAVNQEVAGRDTPVSDGDEVAFFPPVTGG